MTMLDERLRRVGEELDRAAVAYAARSTERAYVAPAPPRPRRQRLVVAVLAACAVFVGAALTLRASSDDGRTMADSQEARAIAQSLGDQWLWPDADSGVPAGTPEEITREFALRVLGLSDFTVVHEAPDPVGMRIETATMTLSLLTARVPGPTDRWVVYELKSSALSLSGNALVVTSPRGTASLDFFVRDASGGHAERLDTIPSAGNPIGVPISEALVSALVVFRGDHGEVIGAASVDAESITSQSLITCTFDLNGESTTASLHAALGDTASAGIGVYTARVDVVEGRNAGAGGPSLRVSLSGPPALYYAAEGDLSRTQSPSGDSGVLGGSTTVEGGGLTFTCTAANPGSR